LEVLVGNPFAQEISSLGLEPSFWSSKHLIPGDHFSLSKLLSVTFLVGYSPFLDLDAKVALHLLFPKPLKRMFSVAV
jgi:hypothetical protein